MPSNWFYARDGQRFGPINDKQLKTLADSAQLLPTDHVWREGMKDWVPASKVAGLFVAVAVVAAVAQPALAGEVGDAAAFLSGLALREVCEALGATLPVGGLERAFDLLVNRFRDQSQRLPQALDRANRKAWRALRSALAAETWWQKCKEATVHADERALVGQIRDFLDTVELPGRKERPDFCAACLEELQRAEESGDLGGEPPSAEELAKLAAAFARYDRPAGMAETEWRLLEALAAKLRPRYPKLGWLLEQKPSGQAPLLVLAARYFFRREVEEDRQLFQGLTFAQLEGLSRTQQQGFALLSQQGERVERSLTTILATMQATHGGVLRIEEELQKQSPQLQQVYQMVLELHQRLNLQGKELRAGASFSVRTEDEKRQVKAFLDRYRQMPSEERRARPALLNAVAKLEVAAGDFQAAQKDFQEVATLVQDAPTQAEVHYNRYLSHLEGRNWAGALEALGQAVELAPEQYAPFPLHKYQPRTILGAGGFGVAFLCENALTGAQVVLKTLRSDRAGVDVKQILREARALGSVRHPAVIQLFDCDYVDRNQTRAYLVMDYFDPQTLEKLVAEKGPLAVAEFTPMAVQIAEGMLAAHEKGVLHRDIKPANILVRRGRSGWEVKLIDFGLAVAQAGSAGPHASTARSQATEYGAAGTVDYAAPEQLGKLAGIKVGPYTDVYGFARTCCFALFGTPQPLPRHFRNLPDSLTDLIQDCLEETPARRPSSFFKVLEALGKLGASPAKVEEGFATGVEIVEEAPPKRPVQATQPMTPVGRSWYYLHGEQRIGPVDEPNLIALIAANQVGPDDLVWCEGMPDWVRAGAIDALFPVVMARPRKAGVTISARIRLVIPPVQGLLAAGASHSWRVVVDGKMVGEGWARDGLTLDLELTPGRHRFDMVKWEGGEDDRKRFELEFPRVGQYEVRFSYSWVLGKFSIGGVDWALQNSKLEIVSGPG